MRALAKQSWKRASSTGICPLERLLFGLSNVSLNGELHPH
jgi:hypothetical protein